MIKPAPFSKLLGHHLTNFKRWLIRVLYRPYVQLALQDAIVALDDSIVRGNTLKNAILRTLDKMGPTQIVAAPPAMADVWMFW